MLSKKMNDRYLFLSKEIKKHNFLYYTKGESEISDIEYDELFSELQKIESLMDIIPNDSPSQNVGGEILSELQKYEHKTPLLSIPARSNSIDELLKWYNQVGGEGTEIIVQPKCDGITINIDYENFVFKNAATRGNGYIGENITQSVNSILSFPRNIKNIDELSVRGEALLDFDFFMNNLVDNKNEKNYKNPRNAIAGILRQLDTSKIKNKKPFIIFYDICEFAETHTFATDEEYIKFLLENNFETIPYFVVNTAKDLISICTNQLNGIIKEEKGFNVCSSNGKKFLCDGLVLKVNDLNKRKDLGFVSKGPKWAFAYKFKSLNAIATIKNINWNIGRTGRLTPVANFWEPVSLGGSHIINSTLNNYNYIKNLKLTKPCKISDIRDILIDDGILFAKDDKVPQNEGNDAYIVKDIDVSNDLLTLTKKNNTIKIKFNEFNCYRVLGLHINDNIRIEKSNDIIPKIICIVGENNSENNIDKKSVNVPKYCPSCGTTITKIENLHFCENINCPSRLIYSLSHFAERDAANIKGLSEKTLELLLSKNIISTISDIYILKDKKDSLLLLEKFGEKKVENLLNSIEKSKNIKLPNFLYSLGIDGIGLSLSKQLVDHFTTLDNLINASYEELFQIQDIGDINAKNIISFFKEENNKKLILQLKNIFNFESQKKLSDIFTNMSFVLTGTLKEKKSYYQKIIENNNGKCASSVSKNIDVVLIGDKAGNKKDKAESLKKDMEKLILIYSHEEFIEFVNQKGGVL